MSDTVDPFNVKGSDGIVRTLDEHYNGRKDVEQDPYGAWLAIQNLCARVTKLEVKLAKHDALMAAGFAEYERRLAQAVAALELYSCDDGCNECPEHERDRVSCGWTARAALASIMEKNDER